LAMLATFEWRPRGAAPGPSGPRRKKKNPPARGPRKRPQGDSNPCPTLTPVARK
jgi:hypothetical protein